MIKLDVLVQGFPGRASICGLSWSSMILLQTQGRNILVDLGAYPARKYLLAALKERGLAPKDIDTVLFTHLHHDHIAAIDAFPHAQFVYGRREWEYANLTTEAAVQQASLSLLHAYPRRLIEDGEEVLPGVTAMLTPGHTPGGISYVVDVNGENWIITGDAVKNRGELLYGDLDMSSAAQDSAESIRRVRERADVVVPGHDCPLRVHPDGRVEPLCENVVTITFPKGVAVNGQNPLVLRVD